MKKLKDMQGENQVTKKIIDSAHQIWLAGLGAFAKTQEEGTKLFEALVKEGEEIESRSRKVAEEKFEEAKTKTTDTWDKLEQVFEDRVSRALNRLGVPTNDDIQSLSKRMEELNSTIKELIKNEQSSSKGQESPKA